MACGRYSYQLLFFSLVAFLHGTTLAASTTSTAQVLPPRTSVKGYVDAGYQWIEEDSLNGGFRLQSAALYLEHRYQQTRFFFDLPIQWEGPLDTDNDGTADSAATNNFVLARERTQLYVEHGFTDWTVTLGQFDSIYGFESADSADIFFARLAWVGINVSHTTHNGLLVNRQFAPHWSLNFIVADAGGQGALGNTSPEYGIQIGWTQNNGYLKLGYIEYSDHGDPMRFSEALVGWSQPKWELHLELDHVDQVPTTLPTPGPGAFAWMEQKTTLEPIVAKTKPSAYVTWFMTTFKSRPTIAKPNGKLWLEAPKTKKNLLV